MTFHDLHHGDAPLLLPNAWDVLSALAFADAGFRAIGTTSFGVAASLGLPDGDRSTRAANLALATALASLPVYLSVDIEGGYDDDPTHVADYVAELAALGVAGINVEDSTAQPLVAPNAHAAKVAAIKDRNPEMFVNARVDTYWLTQDNTAEATIDRAACYVAAGADGVFVPGAADPALLRQLSAAISVPLNVLVVPTLTMSELGTLGVRRVSTGSLPYRAAIDAAVEVAGAVRDGHTPPSATPYSTLQNRLLRYAKNPWQATDR